MTKIVAKCKVDLSFPDKTKFITPTYIHNKFVVNC